VRLTIAEASDLLGISKDAVRMRIKRGTLRSEKTDDRVYVWLNNVPDADQNADANADSTALIAAKDETIRTLRDQLESERRANEENRRLLAGLIERMPALDAGAEPLSSQEPSRAPGAAAEESVRAESRPTAGGSQEAPQRPWWRRVFGG
jgi:excisionase family DNA binding protein